MNCSLSASCVSNNLPLKGEVTVYNRKGGKGCPFCSDALRTSFPEQAISGNLLLYQASKSSGNYSIMLVRCVDSSGVWQKTITLRPWLTMITVLHII